MTLTLAGAAFVLAPVAAHAADGRGPASAIKAAPVAASFHAAADPCSAIPIPSVKQSCENFGKTGSGGGASITDIPGQIEQAIDTWFGNLVKSALTPVMTMTRGSVSIGFCLSVLRSPPRESGV